MENAYYLFFNHLYLDSISPEIYLTTVSLRNIYSIINLNISSFYNVCTRLRNSKLQIISGCLFSSFPIKSNQGPYFDTFIICRGRAFVPTGRLLRGEELAVTDSDTVSVNSFYRGGGRDTDPRGCATPGRPGGISAALRRLRWKDLWILFPPDLFVSRPLPVSRRVPIFGWFLAAGLTIRTLTDHHTLLCHAIKWQKEEIVS